VSQSRPWTFISPPHGVPTLRPDELRSSLCGQVIDRDSVDCRFGSKRRNPPVSESRARDTTRQLDTVVVTGVDPGPGLWKVTRGDHVLWILGTYSPLPRRMRWDSTDVEIKVERSDEVLLTPRAKYELEGGKLGALFLLPSLMRARNNPEGRRLEDVVPSAVYARWLPLKHKYMGSNRAIEKRRPIVAALELYEEAVEHHGLTYDPVVEPTVERAARRRNVTRTDTTVELTIREPRKTLRELARTELDDLDCFELTLARLETEVGAMRAIAHAWAEGDFDSVRAAPRTDQYRACSEAVLRANIAEERGISAMPERLQASWLAHAERALTANRRTFAVVPLRQLLIPGGYLDALAERGYAIEWPERRADSATAAVD